ncbi:MULTISPECIES: tetratricopeptide repeat protein [unclassified Mesorhizobium]|uniref:tetratricopeptide repeat protein n=1 Tax=unclassified Mesorhizobium TaxID=325217 RepID=UPI003338A99B
MTASERPSNNAHNQSDSGDLIRRAVAAFNSGNHDQAMHLCAFGLGQHPGDPALCHLLAAVLFARADMPGARARIEASLAVRPDNVPALILACRIARAEGRFEAALQQLDRAAKLSLQAEILIERARTLDQAGDAPAARECWTLVLQRDPKSQEAAARLGRLAWQRGAPAEAEGFLERAVAGGGHPAAWFDLGLVRQDMRKFGSAAQAYRRVLKMSPDAREAAVNLGVVLQEVGDLDGPWLRIRLPTVCAHPRSASSPWHSHRRPAAGYGLMRKRCVAHSLVERPRLARNRLRYTPGVDRTSATVCAYDACRFSSNTSYSSCGSTRGTAKHCATGVPFLSKPENSGSVQTAGKLMPPSLNRSESTRPVTSLKGRSSRLTGCVANSDQPSSTCMVHKLLNLRAA